MQDMIVMEPGLKVGTRDYVPADLFDSRHAQSHGGMDERTINILAKQKRIVPLTPDSWSKAFTRRPSDAGPPRGLTEAYLREKKIISDTDAAAEPKPKATPKEKPKAGEAITHIEHTADTMRFSRHFITPRKAGPRMLYDVTNEKGELMRAKSFAKLDKAEDFITDMEGGSTESEASGTSEGQQEPEANGGDVQSESEQRDQQGPV